MSVQILSGGDDVETVEVLPLGSGAEVGRSCVIVSYKGKRVMFDCGIHPAHNGLDSLPSFDQGDLATVDLCLVTHFHLDHCGALPYLCNETAFTGQVFMTHPTKAFYKMVMQDYVKVSTSAHDIVTEDWLTNTMAKIETVDYHQRICCKGIRFYPYNAGHVLGAAMFYVEIGGCKILYTGDYSRYPDRHLVGAETPLTSPDVLIVESTYGIQVHETREEREAKFMSYVTTVVGRGGKCLIPVFALGRAQELLLVLEDYWEVHRDLQTIPVYYISSMSKKCTELYKAFGNQMNERVRDRGVNPFNFKHIVCKKDLKDFVDSPGQPCIVLASPGMLQTGVSRELFERWCGDRKNGVILAGYCVEGTLAKQLQTRPKEVTREDGKMLQVRCAESIWIVSFSAHSDFKQTKDFIESIPDTKQVVLVHGNQNAMTMLESRLRDDFRDRGMHVHPSANAKTIRIPFTPKPYATLLGRMARLVRNAMEGYDDDASSTAAATATTLQGVLINQPDGARTIVAREEISGYTGLPTCTLRCGVHIPMVRYHSSTQVLQYLSALFAECTATTTSHASMITIANSVEVSLQEEEESRHHNNTPSHTHTGGGPPAGGSLFVSWPMSCGIDILADSICVALLQLVAGSDTPVSDADRDTTFRLRSAHHFLCQHYAHVVLHLGTGTITFHVTGTEVELSQWLDVRCDNEEVRRDVEKVVRRLYLALFPIALMESEGLCECSA